MTLLIPLSDILKSMNDTSWLLLNIINNKQNLSFNEIRKESNLSQEKCYKELCRLEGGALIVSNRNYSDLRIIGYQISEYGIEALKYQN